MTDEEIVQDMLSHVVSVSEDEWFVYVHMDNTEGVYRVLIGAHHGQRGIFIVRGEAYSLSSHEIRFLEIATWPLLD